MSSFNIINPFSKELTATYDYETLNQIEPKLSALINGFKKWKTSSVIERQDMCDYLAKKLTQEKESLANLISTDMGKPINEAYAEVQKSIDCCKFYKLKANEIKNALVSNHGVRAPIGIILGILPWNYPLWQIIRYLIPALMVGNTCLIKPAFNTHRIALKLVDCFNKFEPTIVNSCIPTNNNTEALIKHPNIAGISFTGSLKSGQRVGSIATSELKPCVLELGGSDPFVVFEDAHLDTALDHAIKARFTNSGQVCIAAKRFFFNEKIYNTSLSLFKKKLAQFCSYGDPLNASTTIGPLSRTDIKTTLEDQLRRSHVTPEMIVYENKNHLSNDQQFPCMIIDANNLEPTAPLLTEEVFGPIAVCQSFTTLSEAIKKANNTKFGLGASIWTTNKDHQKECIEKIASGTIGINTMVRSNFDTPFGGWKKSGLGVELGIDGPLSFTRFKAIQNKKS